LRKPSGCSFAVESSGPRAAPATPRAILLCITYADEGAQVVACRLREWEEKQVHAMKTTESEKTLERLENRPLAAQVRETILEAILDQRFDGGRLPSEDELASMLNVSRTTIRTALHSLEQDGIVTRRRALGTTVNRHVRPDVVALQRLAGFDWLLREKGHKVKVDVSWEREAVPDGLATLFGIARGAECLLTEKRFFAGDEMAIYVRDLVPWSEIETTPGRKLPASLFEFSSQYCREPIDHAVVEIVPTVKRDEATTKLAVGIGDPFARLHERHYSSSGTPLAFSVIDVDDKFIRFEVFRRG
jgi:GntR family transcriptional regulator